MTAFTLRTVPRQPVPTLTRYQVVLMRDMQAGQTVSWTYATGTVKSLLRQLVFDYKVARLVDFTLNGEPQIYQRVELTERGTQVLADIG